jgi:hypothetical protein
MARIPFTLRIEPEERAALEHLSKVERRPINQLLNEAIKLYLSQPSRREKGLEATLESLHAYRKRDPEFKRAKAEFIDAEASRHDPLDGEIVEGQLVDGQFKPAGPVQSKIRDLLSA